MASQDINIINFVIAEVERILNVKVVLLNDGFLSKQLEVTFKMLTIRYVMVIKVETSKLHPTETLDFVIKEIKRYYMSQLYTQETQ